SEVGPTVVDNRCCMRSEVDWDALIEGFRGGARTCSGLVHIRQNRGAYLSKRVRIRRHGRVSVTLDAYPSKQDTFFWEQKHLCACVGVVLGACPLKQ
ncbi:hypothetical protein KI387_013118, partial [Taxus chinensis]